MSLDLVKIREAIAETVGPRMRAAGIDVQAYVQPSPPFPIVGVFPPAGTYVNPWGTFGPDGMADVMFELQTAVMHGAVDSQRLLDRLLSAGTGAPDSLFDALMEDRTLRGTVQDCIPLAASVRWMGEENAAMFVAVIPLRVIAKKEGATV